MKKNKIIIAILMIVFLVSCNDKEYIAPNEFSDVTWYTSLPTASLMTIQAGKYISFMDLSVGALSHEWIIEKQNYFLKPVFSANDSLPLFIDNTLDTICTAKTIHVLFTTAGISKVRLRNTFSEPVTYKAAKPLKAVQEGNVWVIDTTFVYTVTPVAAAQP